jgi:hypothetical protein
MYISFEKLSNEARIWIYQADKPLQSNEVEGITQMVEAFLENWTSHGRQLQAGYMIYDAFFLVIGVEKEDFELSCCVTDSVIQLLQQIACKWEINFLRRDKIVIKMTQGLVSMSINEMKKKLETGEINKDMYTFDNTITCKKALAEKWLLPIKSAWFFKKHII